MKTLRNLSRLQNSHFDYLVRLNEEYEDRDYSKYGNEAEVIRDADLAFMNKVGNALRTNKRIWE